MEIQIKIALKDYKNALIQPLNILGNRPCCNLSVTLKINNSQTFS